MANVSLFNTLVAKLAPTDTSNWHGAPAYAYTPRHKLAQLTMTGCLNQTFYADAEVQLDEVLALTRQLDTAYIARAALYARERGYMKDMPALLVAVLAARGAAELPAVFGRVIDNGKMLRNFVQIMRSGATGRKSLGSRPKKLVQHWLNTANEGQLLQAAVGNAPSLADVVKMVHPKPAEPWREAWFAFLIGQPYDAAALPPLTRGLVEFRAGTSRELPQAPFLLLSNERLTREQWAELATRMSWQALRMNLNTLARHGVFDVEGMADEVARKLADPTAVKRARAFPYQLLAAWSSVDDAVPAPVRDALQDALDVALSNVPRLNGQVVVCPDVSGSMGTPVTGYRKGATTTVRCVDVAALVAAALVRTNRTVRVLPFAENVVNVQLNARDSVVTNAQKLAALGGGGTNCSAPLALLARERARVDTVIIVSDNESWLDARRPGATETLVQWQQIKRHNPGARLICIDLQPHGTTQAPNQPDILNVGGFGDAVFDVIAAFSHGSFAAGQWVEAIEAMTL